MEEIQKIGSVLFSGALGTLTAYNYEINVKQRRLLYIMFRYRTQRKVKISLEHNKRRCKDEKDK